MDHKKQILCKEVAHTCCNSAVASTTVTQVPSGDDFPLWREIFKGVGKGASFVLCFSGKWGRAGG